MGINLENECAKLELKNCSKVSMMYLQKLNLPTLNCDVKCDKMLTNLVQFGFSWTYGIEEYGKVSELYMLHQSGICAKYCVTIFIKHIWYQRLEFEDKGSSCGQLFKLDVIQITVTYFNFLIVTYHISKLQ